MKRYARLREESDRVSNYLQEASRRPLLVTVESELLSQRSLEVCSSFFFRSCCSKLVFSLRRL